MTFKHGDGWRLLREAEGDSEVGGEDVTQNCMMARCVRKGSRGEV